MLVASATARHRNLYWQRSTLECGFDYNSISVAKENSVFRTAQ